jgi:hypothetical protein
MIQNFQSIFYFDPKKATTGTKSFYFKDDGLHPSAKL